MKISTQDALDLINGLRGSLSRSRSMELKINEIDLELRTILSKLAWHVEKNAEDVKRAAELEDSLIFLEQQLELQSSMTERWSVDCAYRIWGVTIGLEYLFQNPGEPSATFTVTSALPTAIKDSVDLVLTGHDRQGVKQLVHLSRHTSIKKITPANVSSFTFFRKLFKTTAESK